MQGFVLAEQGHVVLPLAPVDANGGKTGVRFSMKNWAHASVIVALGVTAAAPTDIIVNAATVQGAGGGSSQALAFDYYACTTLNGDIIGAKQSVAATGITVVTANDNVFYVLEIDARHLPDGYPYVEVKLDCPGSSILGCIVAVLSGGRHQSNPQDTVIT